MGLISDIKEKITGYADVYIKLMKLSFIDRTSHVISYLIYLIICMLIGFCVLLFGGFGLSEALAEAGMPKSLAFLTTIGCFILVLLAFVLMRKKITRKLADTFIDVLTDDDTEQGSNTNSSNGL